MRCAGRRRPPWIACGNACSPTDRTVAGAPRMCCNPISPGRGSARRRTP
jgi:hypothetical protein